MRRGAVKRTWFGNANGIRSGSLTTPTAKLLLEVTLDRDPNREVLVRITPERVEQLRKVIMIWQHARDKS